MSDRCGQVSLTGDEADYVLSGHDNQFVPSEVNMVTNNVVSELTVYAGAV